MPPQFSSQPLLVVLSARTNSIASSSNLPPPTQKASVTQLPCAQQRDYHRRITATRQLQQRRRRTRFLPSFPNLRLKFRKKATTCMKYLHNLFLWFAHLLRAPKVKRTLGFRKDLPKKAVSIVNASSPLIECASKTCKKVEEARVLINLLQFKYRFSLSVTEESEAKKKRRNAFLKGFRGN